MSDVTRTSIRLGFSHALAGRRRAVELVCAVAVLLVGAPVFAQGIQTGSLVGTARGPEGAALPGVTVIATSSALQGERRVVTGGNGDYSIPALPVGLYRVVFHLEGMTRVEAEAAVDLGRTARADAMLETANAAETLVVEGRLPSALESTVVSTNVLAEEVDALPIDRGPLGVTEIAAGITDRSAFPGSLSISGGIGYDNSIMVDGVDIVHSFFGNMNGPHSPEVGLFIEEAIAETQTLTGAISAEYGRFTGGVVNVVTRSGGNDLRGSLRVDLSNPSWRDEDPLEEAAGVSRASNRNEVLSGSVGGKIAADRLWYFVAASQSDRSDQQVFPNTGLQFVDRFDNQRFELKLTGNLRDSHTLELVVHQNESDVDGVSPPLLGAVVDPRATDQHRLSNESTTLSYAGVFANDLLVEGRYSEREFRAENYGGANTALEESPFISFSGEFYNAPFFDESDPSQDFDTEQLTGSLSKFFTTRDYGSHELKVGLESYVDTTRGGNSQSSTGVYFVANYLTDANGIAVLDSQQRLQPEFSFANAVAFQNLALRGAVLEIETLSLFLNDTWRWNERWSFNLGARYEQASGDASDVGGLIDVSTMLPRLAATYAFGEGARFCLSGGYAEYAGRYAPELFNETSNALNFDEITWVYIGPPGAGLDFAPGFDLANYVPLDASFPTVNVRYEGDVSTPVSEEIFLSFGADLGSGSWIEASLVDRTFTNGIEDFIEIENGFSVVDTPVGPLVADNRVVRNSSLPRRDYRALELQGFHRIMDNWTVRGTWTWQLENDGNFQGSGDLNPVSFSGLGDRPELQTPSRNHVVGNLAESQEHKLRIWSLYDLALGRAGNLGLGLLASYDTGRVFSLSTRYPLTEQQLARDPGYVGVPSDQTLFFGERGRGEFPSSLKIDLAATWSLPAWRRLEPWIKFEVRNLLNDKQALSWETAVQADPQSSLDADGLPTGYIEPPGFGNPTSHQTPREFRASLGIRF